MKERRKVFCGCIISSLLQVIFQSTKQKRNELLRYLKYTIAANVPLVAADEKPQELRGSLTVLWEAFVGIPPYEPISGIGKKLFTNDKRGVKNINL